MRPERVQKVEVQKTVTAQLTIDRWERMQVIGEAFIAFSILSMLSESLGIKAEFFLIVAGLVMVTAGLLGALWENR